MTKTTFCSIPGLWQSAVLLFSLLFGALPAVAAHKIRLSTALGYHTENGIAGSGTYCAAPKITIAYPVTLREKDFNTEIGILSIYEAQLTGNGVQVPGFGFGIRIFYNGWEAIRPYFNHEILTRIIYSAGRSGTAKTYSVLLGLGIDVPLDRGRERESASFFADLAYSFYEAGYFEMTGFGVKTLHLTAGYSFPF